MQEYTVREWANGYTQEWRQDGKLHREDGPAIISVTGSQRWYKNGLLHREDGPAVILADGTQRYYLNGILYTYEEWKQKVDSDNCDGKVVEIEGKKYKLQEVDDCK